MSPASGYLFAGEEVALVVRPHAIVLLKPGLAPMAAFALLTALPNRFTLAALVVVFARFVWDVGTWWEDRYILTTDRILSIDGILTKKVASLPLAKITDLTYSRSLIGRLLGYGTLDLESAGQRDFGKINFLPDPDYFYRAVMSLALGPRPEGEPPEDPGQAPTETLTIDEARAVNPDRDPTNTDEIPIIRKSDD